MCHLLVFEILPTVSRIWDWLLCFGLVYLLSFGFITPWKVSFQNHNLCQLVQGQEKFENSATWKLSTKPHAILTWKYFAILHRRWIKLL